MLFTQEKQPISAMPEPASRPWPRETVDEFEWRRAAEALANGRCDLLSLWSDGAGVLLAIFDTEEKNVCILSLACEKGAYPSIGRHHPPALRLERAIRDLYGLEADGAPDRRRWLDHGRWGLRHPLGAGTALETTSDPYRFLPAEGEPLHQIPVGPVHAGIIEPGHFRFSANGETVVRLEDRLGFVHKGIDRLMAGASIDRGATLAARVSGDSTVAHSLAFARAVEAALGIEPPPRAVYLRALMAELGRLANHIGDIGAICNDAAFSLMHAHCGVACERVLRASQACFGHRLMMDRIRPGGVSVDLDAAAVAQLVALVESLRALTPRLIPLYADTASLQDRTVATGVLSCELARQYAAGGFVGRASGRCFDARRTIGYAPYASLSFDLGASIDGDVFAWLRIAGGCSKRPSRETSSWIFPSATNRSIAPTRGMISSERLDDATVSFPGPVPPAADGSPAEGGRSDARRTRADAGGVARRKLGRSLAIRKVDAGSCNGCELEILAQSNAFYDLERFGLRFVASPRHADVLVVTGPVTKNMREALERTYAATPDPKWAVAVGDCAFDGGVFAGSYACVGAVSEVVPVDLHIRGCPPDPMALLKGLISLVEETSPRR